MTTKEAGPATSAHGRERNGGRSRSSRSGSPAPAVDDRRFAIAPIARPGSFPRRGLHSQVAHELGARILSGVLVPGASLPNEADFSTDFRVSRTVLREAIKLLSAKGLVESRPKTGTRVRPRDQWNMLDPDILAWWLASGDVRRFADHLFEMRRIIEPPAAALAALRADASDRVEMARAFQAMAAAGDIASSIEPDLDFHRAILKATGNHLLGALGMVIDAALSISFRIGGSRSKEAPELNLPEHRAVLDAIQAGDPTAAHRAMERLLDKAGMDLARAIEATGLAAPPRGVKRPAGNVVGQRKSRKAGP